MKTSVVIPTKSSISTIYKCLASLMPYYANGYISEIIIVDGHSTDGTLEVVKQFPVELLFEEEEGSIGMAYEIGWRQSNGELIILFDSDVYMGDGFFPQVFDFFSDTRLGWVSCQPKAVISNQITRAQAEDWVRGAGTLDSKSSLFRRLYHSISSGGNQKPLCGGPCMVVRRVCLEKVDGLQGLSKGTIGSRGTCLGDICLSQRIVRKGWEAIWWTDAPVFHHPRPTLKGFMKQMYGYGKAMSYMHTEEEFKKDYSTLSKIFSLLARLASPLIGIYMAIRFRNARHIYLYPLPRYAWVVGYINGWLAARKSKQTIYRGPIA